MGNGWAEEEALHFLDRVLGRDQSELFGGLDALDRNRQAKLGTEAGDPAEKNQRPVTGCEALEEGAVYLDLVERQAVQIAEARITGAEIVERQANPKLAELTKRLARGPGILEKHRLGDLDLEPARGQARGRQRFAYRID